MRAAMKAPFVSFGSDGSALPADPAKNRGLPHPRSFGTFARVMGEYVREQKVLTLEEAVRKASSENAAKVRLFDRGLLRPGLWADVALLTRRPLAIRPHTKILFSTRLASITCWSMALWSLTREITRARGRAQSCMVRVQRIYM